MVRTQTWLFMALSSGQLGASLMRRGRSAVATVCLAHGPERGKCHLLRAQHYLSAGLFTVRGMKGTS